MLVHVHVHVHVYLDAGVCFVLGDMSAPAYQVEIETARRLLSAQAYEAAATVAQRSTGSARCEQYNVPRA